MKINQGQSVSNFSQEENFSKTIFKASQFKCYSFLSSYSLQWFLIFFFRFFCAIHKNIFPESDSIAGLGFLFPRMEDIRCENHLTKYNHLFSVVAPYLPFDCLERLHLVLNTVKIRQIYCALKKHISSFSLQASWEILAQVFPCALKISKLTEINASVS